MMGTRLYGRMVVTRWCPETGEEVELEVEVDGMPFPPEPATGLLGWGMEDVGATVHGGEHFPLSEREVERAVEVLTD